MWPEYGFIESFEGDRYDETLFEAASRRTIMTSEGHLVLSTDTMNENCLQVEVYPRRPPVETKGWDTVVEVGYTSPKGRIALKDLTYLHRAHSRSRDTAGPSPHPAPPQAGRLERRAPARRRPDDLAGRRRSGDRLRENPER